MKYIRTQKGHIYEYVEQRIYPSQYTKFGLYRHNLNSEYELITAIADTIEELCDWFFLEGAKGYPINYKKFYTAKKSKERMDIKQNLYGVIFIRGKGLKYVAIMNDKGELELI